MNGSVPDRTGLMQLRDELAALEFIDCGMQHERVRLENGLPVPLEHETADPAYQRNSLCSKEKRSQRPGCGHTTARILMARALEENGLFPAEQQDRVTEWTRRLRRLDAQVCGLDHNRGHAELVKARLLEALHPAGGLAAGRKSELHNELRAIRARIHALSEEHSRYVDALHGLRDEMLLALDRVTRPQDA